MDKAPTRQFAFRSLDRELVSVLEPWFDDVVTQRYLGDRHWIRRQLDLVSSQPGTEFRGRIVVSRHAWVAIDDGAAPVAFVTVEVYDDATAGIAFVVDPAARGEGVCRRMLLALADEVALYGVERFVGAVEPDNVASQSALRAAGFAIASEVDDEDMLAFVCDLAR